MHIAQSALLALALGVSVGCGASQPSQQRSNPALPPLSRLAPQDAEFWVSARLDAVIADATFMRVLDLLYPPEGRQALYDRSGVALEEVRELIVAWMPDDSYVLLMRVPGAKEIAEATSRRMVPVEVRSDARDRVRRIGYLGTERFELLALDDETLLIGRDQGLYFAELLRRLDAGLEFPGGELERLLPAAPIALIAPSRLPLPLGSPLAILLARQETLVLAIDTALTSEAAAQEPARGAGSDAIRFALTMEGEFPPGVEQNLQQLFSGVAQTDLGRLVGLAESGLRIERSEDEARALRLRFALGAPQLTRAIEVLFLQDIQELLASPILAAPSR